MVSVMLVDDHTMFREGLRRSFEECDDIQVVGEAGTAEELMKNLPRNKPNVVILDIKLPDIDGPALIQKIKSASPASKVVILTMFNHPRYALHALQNGADGFVVKGSPFSELLTGSQNSLPGQDLHLPRDSAGAHRPTQATRQGQFTRQPLAARVRSAHASGQRTFPEGGRRPDWN